MPRKRTTPRVADDEENTTPVEPETPPEEEPPASIPSTPLEPAIPRPITQSILLTIKKMLGIAEEYHAFDLDLIININSVFLTLNQLGVGPDDPYQISGTDEQWADFLGDQASILQGVQSYIYLKVRLLFDPPANSFLVDSIQKQCSEFEFRFNTQVEYKASIIKEEMSDEPTEPEEPPIEEEPEETPTPTEPEPEVYRRARAHKKRVISSKANPIDIFR